MKNKTLYSLIFGACTMLQMFGCASNCKSPINYVKEVYSTGDGFIEYELKDNMKYNSINIVYFGIWGKTLQENTIQQLASPKAKVRIPAEALEPPPQRWFNFAVEDQNGCTVWSLVNERPLQRSGNIIGIDEPTPGRGHAFVLK